MSKAESLVAFSDVKVGGHGQRGSGSSVIGGNTPYNLWGGETAPGEKSNRLKIKNKEKAQDGRGLGKTIIKQENLTGLIDKMKLSLSKKTKSVNDKFATQRKIAADGIIGNSRGHNVSQNNNTLNDIVLRGSKENPKSDKSSLHGFAKNNSLIIQKFKTNTTNSSSNIAIFNRESGKAAGPGPSPIQKPQDPTLSNPSLPQNPPSSQLTPIRSISKTIEVNINDASGRGNFPSKIKLDPLITRKAHSSNGLIKTYSAGTHNGLIRNYNEDRLSIVLNYKVQMTKSHCECCNFFGIYDGHGGYSVADNLKNF